MKDNLPQSDVGREYYLQNMEKEVGHVMVAMVIIALSHGIVSTAKDLVICVKAFLHLLCRCLCG